MTHQVDPSVEMKDFKNGLKTEQQSAEKCHRLSLAKRFITHPRLQELGAITKPLLSIFLLFLSKLFITASNVMVRTLEKQDAFVINGLANVLISFISLAILLIRAEPIFPKGFRPFLMLRGVLGTFNFVVYAHAVKHMPLGDMNIIITATSPLAVFMAWVLLGEEVQFNDLLNLLLTTVGIILVTQPPMIFSWSGSQHTVRDDDYCIAALLVMTSCLTLALCYILLRKMQEVPSMSVVFVMGTETAVLSLSAHLYIDPCHTLNLSYQEILSILGIGLMLLLAQFTMTLGSQVECAGLASIVSQTFAVALAYGAQLLLYQNYPDDLSLLGILLVALVIINVGCRRVSESLGPENTLRASYEQLCCVPWPKFACCSKRGYENFQ